MLTETQSLELAANPERIIDPVDCGIVIGYLNGHITDLDLECFEREIATNNEHVQILQQEGKSIALKEAEWKTSKLYLDWRRVQMELRKYRAYRNVLKRKEETLQFTSRQTRQSYGGYPRAIE